MNGCHLLHANEEILLPGSTRLRGTFALPTDDTDLNHIGVLLQFINGITFYNTGDTGYCDLLKTIVPHQVDICAVCINGGYHNLDATRAAELVKAIEPHVTIPSHFDMMINNVGNPWMFRSALDVVGSTARCVILPYYEPWLYRRGDVVTAIRIERQVTGANEDKSIDRISHSRSTVKFIDYMAVFRQKR